VVKTANLRYGNHSSEFQRCTGLGSGASFASERCVLDS
jgi:hypothetical protein